MFDTICTFPLPADLFAQAVHPSEPLLAVGLSSGHVSTLKLPPVEEDGEEEEERPKRRGSNGTGFIDTLWQTKRHKGSCRSLGFSLDGKSLYSAGGDGLLKAADTTTGQVTGKVLIPLDSSYSDEDVDAPTVLHALSPQTLLLATDSGALHLYDLRDPAPSLPVNAAKTAFTKTKPSQTHHPHTDYISSLTPLPPSQTSTSGFSKQFLTTGGTTLALTDIRRGVLVKSEDQEELLLSATYVTGLPAKKSSGSSGEKTLVGGANGVITLWEKGQWDDQEERIYVSRDKETLDCLTLMPDGIGGFGKHVAVGLGDGSIRFVRLSRNDVTVGAQHDDIEGVVGLDFDVGGRMVSGGGQICKVWQEHVAEDEDEDEDVEESAVLKRAASDSDVDSDEERDSDSEEEEVTSKKPKKKRKRGKGPAGGPHFSFAGLD